MPENKKDILDLLWYEPVQIAHWVGFKDMTELHNKWLRSFLYKAEDQTLQAHRGSYKTTTLSLFFAIHSIIKPNETLMFFRKSGIAEVILQTGKILQSGCFGRMVNILYDGKELKLLKASSFEINTNLRTNVKGQSQITGCGMFGAITGKHADIVVTDDIVNINDRISEAERNHTKTVYQELQNVKNRGGRFINVGTPWHKDDCFTLMPNPVKYDCYHTGLMNDKQIQFLKDRMTPSLFAANYELKHIAAEDVIFFDPQVGAEAYMVEHGIMHLDSAFYGEDYTAWSIMSKKGGKYYLYGKMRRKHVQECYSEIISDYQRFMCGKMYNEENADKGMVGKELRKLGLKVVLYSESMNKFLKIATYLKAIWKDVIFVEGTDEDYIEQICDFNENAAHDDAPDSASSLARLLLNKREGGEYKPLWA